MYCVDDRLRSCLHGTFQEQIRNIHCSVVTSMVEWATVLEEKQRTTSLRWCGSGGNGEERSRQGM
jgi:hypothetical protein